MALPPALRRWTPLGVLCLTLLATPLPTLASLAPPPTRNVWSTAKLRFPAHPAQPQASSTLAQPTADAVSGAAVVGHGLPGRVPGILWDDIRSLDRVRRIA
ncbi:MAG: hypothetical protein GTO53_09110 [Planctomycetales bacterium]|nr:hypothetical protein [Planctomycetales bacterium]NIM09285.1 hypothetical protein [Planctomycetales bacterium]NIN08753.1 hypothetical protein [Planctomycetales bacterium]NIN77872.1 hypothetical protein [Planctomycetales bacterium]NIO35055.1 hypothetical protein [Planctomycetales bacterium]